MTVLAGYRSDFRTRKRITGGSAQRPTASDVSVGVTTAVEPSGNMPAG